MKREIQEKEIKRDQERSREIKRPGAKNSLLREDEVEGEGY